MLPLEFARRRSGVRLQFTVKMNKPAETSPHPADAARARRRLRLQAHASVAERSACGIAGRQGAFPNLLVGNESSDDAAVYRLNDTQALVATTDFFMPIVDDPYDFGRIAATNAISDVYAMGARPIMALALLGMPVGKLPIEVVQRIVAGGQAVCEAAGIPIAGGHSIDSPEPIYGLVALGLVDPRKVKRNDRAQAGDVLILGKALGVAS